MSMLRGCKCGKHMLEAANEGTCLWCGRGLCAEQRADERPRSLRRLPQDLGALQREGRRPDLRLDNVVRLDRLRDRWQVPAAVPVGQRFHTDPPLGRQEAA